MPASSREASAPAPRGRAARAGPRARSCLGADAQAVSEVIGFILIFGIISAIMVLGMLAFQSAADDAKERVTELHGQGAADRVAALVVEAALFAESHGSDARFAYLVDLPEELEGDPYTVLLDAAAQTVQVDTGVDVLEAQLFQAGGSPTVKICTPDPAGDHLVPGGPLYVRFGDPETEPEAAKQFDVQTTPCIYLETAQ